MDSRDLRNLPEADAAGLNAPLLALWHDSHGDWDAAHAAVDHLETHEAARVHAYLHRKEGDAWNAGYWYRQAGVPVFTGSLDDEWETLVQHFLRA